MIPAAIEADRVRRLEILNLKLEASELRTKAELVRLRGQLEPHFLLNTLNLIAGLVGTDNERARAVLVSLGDLLQDTLSEHSELQPISSEIGWLRRYVEILETRHGDRLRVEWSVDSAAETALVPRLLLQPLVENAIRHGALRRKGGGRVVVDVRRCDSDLECTISDDGPGLGKPRVGALGVENVKARVELHFPTGTFDLKDSESGGARAVIRIPFTTASQRRSHLETRE